MTTLELRREFKGMTDEQLEQWRGQLTHDIQHPVSTADQNQSRLELLILYGILIKRKG